MTKDEARKRSVKEAVAGDPPTRYAQVGLKGEGRREKTGHKFLCPFHADTDPSLHIYNDGRFKCFGCEAEGDIFDFVGRLHNIPTFSEQLAFAGDALGIAPPPDAPKVERRRKVGERHWSILDAQGQYLASHYRADYSDGSKRMWWQVGDSNGLGGLDPNVFPLHGTADLVALDRPSTVVVVEGEKARDAAQAAGLIALGTFGAGTTPSEEALSHLVAHEVLLWPDNDDEGRAHMERVARVLGALEVPCSIITWPDAPPKGDAADFFEKHTLTDFEALPRQAHSPQLQVLESESPPPPDAYLDPIAHFVRQATPKAGWIADYIRYAAPFSECPEQFLLVGALTALSVAAGTSAFMLWGDERLLANTYFCLVGPQSIPRKSTALRTSRRLVEEAIAGPVDAEGEPTSISISETGSDEGILEEIAAKPAGVLWWSELSAALAQSQKRYSGGLKQLLAELFDAAGQARTHKVRDAAKTIRVENPCPHVLAATTIAWLKQQVGEWDLYGGFLSRFCYVFGERKSKKLPIKPEHNADQRRELIGGLQRIPREAGELAGTPFRLGAEAEAAYCRFYDEFEDRPELRASDAVASFASRLTTYVLKVAMLYELALDPASREVRLAAWEHAVGFVEMCYSGAIRILEEIDRGGDPELNRVVRVLREAGPGGIGWRELMRAVRIRKDRLEPIVTTLGEAGMLQAWMVKTGGRDARMLRYEPR